MYTACSTVSTDMHNKQTTEKNTSAFGRFYTVVNYIVFQKITDPNADPQSRDRV